MPYLELLKDAIDITRLPFSTIAEYYNSRTGAIPQSAALAFGWTAAVFIDLAIRESHDTERGRRGEAERRPHSPYRVLRGPYRVLREGASRRRGDTERRRQGDAEQRRRGDAEKLRKTHASPRHRVPASAGQRVAASPGYRVAESVGVVQIS